MKSAVAPIAATKESKVLVAAGVHRICGFSFCEVTGAADAKVTVYDGLDATGILLSPVTLLPFESTEANFPADSRLETKPVSSGSIFLHIEGEIEGSVTWA